VPGRVSASPMALFRRAMASRIRLHLHSLLLPLCLSGHTTYLNPLPITACSPCPPRRPNPCQSQRAIRFQDATRILLRVIYSVTLAIWDSLTPSRHWRYFKLSQACTCLICLLPSILQIHTAPVSHSTKDPSPPHTLLIDLTTTPRNGSIRRDFCHG
jgi:hypothetical protein